MLFFHSYTGLIILEKNIGESSNQFYNRLDFIKSKLNSSNDQQFKIINSTYLESLELKSKKQISQDFLGCTYN